MRAMLDVRFRARSSLLAMRRMDAELPYSLSFPIIVTSASERPATGRERRHWAQSCWRFSTRAPEFKRAAARRARRVGLIPYPGEEVQVDDLHDLELPDESRSTVCRLSY